ncbi:MAG: hypothetical protein L0H36_00415 [bacterium]|nr:hypothetical protein [bacterium]MDN5835080.1 hypothetical protein [bacterium]
MDIERSTPERITDSTESFDELFGDLSEFADKIGGKSWQENRACRIGFERSVSMQFEDCREAEIAEYPLETEEISDPEDIRIRFDAEKELLDNEYFYTSYDIEYTHVLPTRVQVIPEHYKEHLNQAVTSYNEDNDADIGLGSYDELSEVHMHRYSVLEEDDSILYTEDIVYSYMDIIDIAGESFHSVNDRSIVHSEDTDQLAHELGPYYDQTESNDSDDPETILYDQTFAEITDNNEEIETLFQDNNEHARRIMALLSLLGSDLVN